MKPKREITLGEMQDECKFRGDNCETIGGDKCKFFELCASMQTIDKGCLTPIMWNLTDPPRFTEAQMAFWKALYSVGVSKVFKAPSELKFSTKSTTLPTAGNMGSLCCEAWNWLGSEELLDLAELFGDVSK